MSFQSAKCRVYIIMMAVPMLSLNPEADTSFICIPIMKIKTRQPPFWDSRISEWYK